MQLEHKIHKGVLRIPVGMVLAVIIAAACFGSLSGLPIPFIEAVDPLFVLLALVFVFIRFVMHYKVVLKHALDRYVLFLMVFLPFYSAFRAKAVFGQPLLYGVLTQRTVWLIGVVLIFAYWLRRGVIHLFHVRDGLIWMAWLWLGFCTLLWLLIDPRIFADQFPNFAGGGEYGGYIYKFDPILLVFAGFYFLFKGALSKQTINYYQAAPFLIFIVFVINKRSLTLALLLAIGVVFWLFLDRKRFAYFFSKALLAMFVFAILITMAMPSQMEAFVWHFNEAFSVVITGKEGGDASSNARITEMLLAWPYILENWFLGNGDLSVRWNDGYEGTMGYFYPSDIGLLGGLFIYGLFGMIFIYAQFIFLRNARQLWRGAEDRVLLMSTYGALLVLLFQSFVKGNLVFYPAASLFFICLIEYMRLSRRNNPSQQGVSCANG